MIIKPRQVVKAEPKVEKKEEPKRVEKPIIKQNSVKKEAPRKIKIEEEEDLFLFEDEENKE